MKKYFFISIVGLFQCFGIYGQIELPPTFNEILEVNDISFIYPIENQYKVIKRPSQSLVPVDLGLKSRKHHIEIWFQFLPETDSHPLVPHVETMRQVFHLATNDPNELFTTLPINPQKLDSLFNASWGLVNVFKPKIAFSDKSYCKLLSLYKEQVGVMFVYFLFNKPTLEVDNRFQAIIFN